MDELKHFGVKGMKWGVRKEVNPSADHKAYSDAKKKKLKDMSTEELEAVVKRMKALKVYRSSSSLIAQKKPLAELTNAELEVEGRRLGLKKRIIKEQGWLSGLTKMSKINKMSMKEVDDYIKKMDLTAEYKKIAYDDWGAIKFFINGLFFNQG